MAQSRCRTRQRSGVQAPQADILISSKERSKRKGSAAAAEAALPPPKRQAKVHIAAPEEREERECTPQASGQDNSTAECHTPGGGASSQGQGGTSGQAASNRSAAQSPRRGHAHGGPAKLIKPAGVLNTLLSPVLTLLHGGGAKPQEQQHAQQEHQQQQQPPDKPAPKSGFVLLEDGRKAHVGLHHCDGGPEPGRHGLPLQQVEGMPMQAAGACEGAGSGRTGSAGDGAAEGTSTDGESDTRIDEGAVCASASSSEGREAEGAPAAPPASYEEDEYEEECTDFDPYAFIKNLPPLQQVVPRWRRSLLPRQTRACKRKTLVLDLDETLVHSTLDGCDSPDFSFPVSFNNREHRVHVRRRPHLGAFLQRCAELFEVVVFTASQKVYAEQLLNILDPSRAMIRHRVFRDSCVLVEGNYLKDLSVLGRDLAHTIIVDNSPQAFGYQLPNGIPIESWYDDEDDAELANLLPFLERLVNVDDVRPPILAAYKLNQLVEKAPTYPPLPLGAGG